MRPYLIPLFLLLGGSSLYAQFGLTVFRNSNEAYAGSGDNRIDLPYAGGYEAAVHYWFRLPKKRVEFQPTVYYAGWLGDDRNAEVGLQLKTNVYPFDFGTDCDCPTFGKQGPQLQKGLFVQLSPGVGYHRFRLPSGAWDGQLAASVGAGVGLDLGVSNLLTLTPLVSVRRTLTDYNDNWHLDQPLELDSPGPTRLTALQLGLQATFRLDKRRY